MKLARILNNGFFATFVPAAVGWGVVALCVKVFASYGTMLFYGVPILISMLSAFCTSFRRKVTFGRAYWISIASLLLAGSIVLIVALDGLMCLIMAFPLAMLLALVGTVMGQIAGSACDGNGRAGMMLLFIAAFPGLVAFEHATAPPVPMRSVTTSVVVDAPIQRVWQTVVAFPKINEPPEGIFRWGIAYPIEARIEGTGVGAVRHCIFSTGPFVEPITRWDEPTLLAFDVDSSPAPMEELSPYEHIEAPHLHGHMVSHRGQFRLIERDGHVMLEGTTWYTHTLMPQWYWGPISDYMIHRIHERVLNHIQRVAEGK